MAKFDVKRQHMLPPDQSQVENQERTDNLLTRAQTLIDEEQDDVKKMNQMVLYSKVVTIRDKQLVESKKLEEEWVREQKKLDIMMEIERLKALSEAEVREHRRKEAQLVGAQVLVDQIKDRELIRQKGVEVREKEKLQLLANIEAQDAKEKQKKEEKNAAIKKMMQEVNVSNQQSLLLKEQKAREDRELDASVAQF